MAPTPAGRFWAVHVAPPSVELTAAPGDSLPTLLPTAVHTDEEGHETAVSVSMAVW
jgi:hypothetical protein